MFCDRMDLEKPLMVPLSVFRRCETFIRKFAFSPKGSPFNCDKNDENFGSVPLSARQLEGPEYVCFSNFFRKVFDYRVL